MIYITDSEFIDRFPLYQGTAFDVSVAISDAGSVIDSYIKSKIKDTEPTPTILKRIASDLTCYYMQVRNMQAREDDAVQQLYKNAEKMLTQIRDGELSLYPQEDTQQGGGVTIVSKAGDYEFRG